MKQHYNNNKKYYVDKAAKWNEVGRQKYIELKESKPCTDCGKFFPYYIMQFDHVSDDKLFTIGNKVRNNFNKSVIEEIEKCEPVCANCHAERTHQRLQNPAV